MTLDDFRERTVGRRVVVSGGGTGIGLATAEIFAAAGDQVVIVGRREEPLRKAADRLNAEYAGDGAEPVGWITADLRDPEAVRRAAASVTADGPVDVIVTNAGGNVAPSHDGT